jgi:microcystin degradation protein MlrC
VGVGNTAEFEIGSKFTPGMPAPMKAEAKVVSLHDGFFRQEGPAGRGFPNHIGKTAVVRIGNIDIMLCENPTASGDPQLLRHFGIEPTLYDLIVVKANTSFRVSYGAFAGEIYYADTPGICASNLKFFQWHNLPKKLYPFDLPADYKVEPAKIWR